MPTNLPAEAQIAWQKYLEAKTTEEKIRHLETFISLVPKHKGTEKLLMQAKKTLTKLKLTLSRQKELKKGTGIHPAFSIPKEEDAQIVLLGLPGVGKTALFDYLTDNQIPYGKTTLLPNIGVFKYGGAVFQIIDLPPIYSDNIDATPNGRSILSLARNSDMIMLVIDISQDIYWQFRTLISLLKNARIIVDRPAPPIRFTKLSRGGIQIYGANNAPFDLVELKELIASLGVQNCILEIYGNVDEEDIINALDRRTVYKKAIIAAMKADMMRNEKNLSALRAIASTMKVVPVSLFSRLGKESIGETIIAELDLIRVWTKKDGKISDRALVLRRGSTVRDAAEKIHSDFIRRFKYAVVERQSARVKKFKVGLNFKLEDNDILVIYTSE